MYSKFLFGSYGNSLDLPSQVGKSRIPFPTSYTPCRSKSNKIKFRITYERCSSICRTCSILTYIVWIEVNITMGQVWWNYTLSYKTKCFLWEIQMHETIHVWLVNVWISIGQRKWIWIYTIRFPSLVIAPWLWDMKQNCRSMYMFTELLSENSYHHSKYYFF